MAKYRYGGSGKNSTSQPKFQDQIRQIRKIKGGDILAEDVKIISFKTEEEIKKFLDNEKLSCPICGGKYKNLGLHTLNTHKISARDLKLRLGIPMKYGLTGKRTKSQCSKRMMKRIEDGNHSPINGGYNRGRKMSSAKRPPYWYAKQKEKSEKGRQIIKENLTRKKEEKVKNAATLLLSGKSKNEVTKILKTSWGIVLEAQDILIRQGHWDKNNIPRKYKPRKGNENADA